MKKSSRREEINGWFLEICPQAISSLRDLIADPSTPVASKVQLIGMVLDRALGKAETPVKVTTSQESMEEAEARLMALVHEFQIEDELREAAEAETAPAERTPEDSREEKAEEDG